MSSLRRSLSARMVFAILNFQSSHIWVAPHEMVLFILPKQTNNQTTMEKSNNNNNFINTDFINVLLTSTKIQCHIKSFNFSEFNSFLRVIRRLYPIYVNSTSKYYVASKLMLFYIAFYHMHNSSVIQRWFADGIHLSIPDFVYSILIRVCLRSESRNKLVGTTYGHLNSNSSSYFSKDVIDLMDADVAVLAAILKGTDFADCVSSEKNCLQLKSVLIDIVHSILPNLKTEVDESVNAELISLTLSLFQDLVSKPDRLGIYQGVLPAAVTTQLSIFRFFSTAKELEYKVSQHHLSISDVSRDCFACFLRLFEPKYFVSDIQSHEHVPGLSDITFSVEHVTTEQAWGFYLDISTTGSFGLEKHTAVSPTAKSERSLVRSFSTTRTLTQSEAVIIMSAGNEYIVENIRSANTLGIVNPIPRRQTFQPTGILE